MHGLGQAVTETAPQFLGEVRASGEGCCGDSHVAVEEHGSVDQAGISVLTTHFHPQTRLGLLVPVIPEGYGEGLSPVLPAAPRKLLLPNTSQHAGEDTHKALGCSVSRTLHCHSVTAGLLLALLGPRPRPESAWREELD